MAKSIILNGYMNPSTGRLDPDAPAPGKSIIINGTGFGAGPNVLLFDQFIGGNLTAALRRPEVGTWSNNSIYTAGIPKIYADSQTQRSYYCGRDPNNIAAAARNQASLFKYTGVVTQFRYMHRAWVPQGFNYPGASTSGVMPVASSWKQTWWGISNAGRTDLIGTDSPDRNVCIPTHVGNGIISVGGNRNGPSWWDETTSSAKAFYYPPNSFTAPTLYSYYQDGAGTFNVFDRTVSIMAINDNTNTITTRNNCDPFHETDGGVFNTRHYDGVRFTGWMLDNSACQNQLPLINDVWIAVGANCWACLFVSDKPDFHEPTRHIYPCYAPTWNDNQLRTRLYNHNDFDSNTHFHIQLSNGTVIENVPFTRV